MRRVFWLALVGLFPVLPFACSTDAVGVQECREIEEARCAAARSCDLGIDSDEELEVCQRYARDNCLHGLATKNTPKSSELNACIGVIEKAGACAKDGKDLASECGIDTYRLSNAVPVCDIIEDPEEATLCGPVLVEETPEVEEPPESDAGGD